MDDAFTSISAVILARLGIDQLRVQRVTTHPCFCRRLCCRAIGQCYVGVELEPSDLDVPDVVVPDDAVAVLGMWLPIVCCK